MRKQFPLIISLFFSAAVMAGDGEYAVTRIDPLLLKNAHVVKRMETSEFQIMSGTKAKLYRKYALTILDEMGERFSYLGEFYDKLRTVKSIDGKLFDSKGKEIRSVKNKDIQDLSAVSGISLMEDSRIKVHDFNYRIYPYTVEYEVTVEYNTNYIFPNWFPQPAEGISVEKAETMIKSPVGYTFRYKAFNYNGEPVIKEENGNKIFSWSINNVQAILKEYACPEWQELTTAIYFSPDKFEIESYKGDMGTWEEYGKFQIELNKGRDVLPESVKQKVHLLTDGIAEKKEKIKRLYDYLQQNTRYISIQLGIGGLQPFDAVTVAKNAYGDCKALSNFMYSLLKEAGIESYYTLIKAGRGEYHFLPDFTSDQFNHIILSVPLQNDTMWLECTSQTLPAGYLGGHTNDRYALAINEKAGMLVHTPKYGLNENTAIRNVKAKLDIEGMLGVKSFTKYAALQQDYLHGMINQLSKEKVKEILEEELDFATYDINRFEYKEHRSELPVIDESLDITALNYATMTGRRLFIVPNVMTRSHRKLSKDETRKYDIVLSYEYRDIDSVEIEIPAGYSVEASPSDVTLQSPFGKYSITSKLKDNKITCYRLLEQYSGRFPASSYNDMVAYYEAIYKADRAKMVLVKNEEAKKGF